MSVELLKALFMTAAGTVAGVIFIVFNLAAVRAAEWIFKAFVRKVRNEETRKLSEKMNERR